MRTALGAALRLRCGVVAELPLERCDLEVSYGQQADVLMAAARVEETPCKECIDLFHDLPLTALAGTIHHEIQAFLDSHSSKTISVQSASSLSKSQVDRCVKLVKDNLLTYYVNSSWGWSESQKYEEMQDEAQRFIIIAEKDELQGYSSFQAVDEDGACLYCYELQLASSLRSQGIGRMLMTMLEKLASSYGFDKVMLTVFVANEAAIQFYRRLGYIKDASSPRPTKRRTRSGTKVVEPDYLIMSKVVT